MTAAEMPNVDRWGNVFPKRTLEGCKTALVLFAAGFGGAQDASFVAQAGIKATCVDVDQEALDRMSAVYPDDWEWVCGDAFDFPVRSKRTWDLVTVDVYTGGFDRAAGMLPVFASRARRAIVLGGGEDTHLSVPKGWKLTERIRRSDFRGGVYWNVLTKERAHADAQV